MSPTVPATAAAVAMTNVNANRGTARAACIRIS